VWGASEVAAHRVGGLALVDRRHLHRHRLAAAPLGVEDGMDVAAAHDVARRDHVLQRRRSRVDHERAAERGLRQRGQRALLLPAAIASTCALSSAPWSASALYSGTAQAATAAQSRYSLHCTLANGSYQPGSSSSDACAGTSLARQRYSTQPPWCDTTGSPAALRGRMNGSWPSGTSRRATMLCTGTFHCRSKLPKPRSRN